MQVEAAEEEQKEEENGVATPPLLLMGEVEARMWRRRFVSAAR